MTRVVKVATTDELQDQEAKLVEVDGEKIALFRAAGVFYALRNACPHRGGPLSGGKVEGAAVICPWHAAKVDIRMYGSLARCASRTTRQELHGPRARGGRRDRAMKLSPSAPDALTPGRPP